MGTNKERNSSKKKNEEEKPEEFSRFEDAMRQVMNLTPEQAAEIRKKVPYSKEERTPEEYNEKISIYNKPKKK